MHIVLGVGRGDQEEQRGGLAVERLIVDAGGHGHGGQARLAHAVGLAVRDGDAVLDARRHLRLAGEDGRLVGLLVVDVALAHHQLDELVNGIGLVLGRTIDLDGTRTKQVCNPHVFFPFPLRSPSQNHPYQPHPRVWELPHMEVAPAPRRTGEREVCPPEHLARASRAAPRPRCASWMRCRRTHPSCRHPRRCPSRGSRPRIPRPWSRRRRPS